jgi:hypothetical protein
VLAAGPKAVGQGHSEHYRDPFRILRTAPAEILRSPYFVEFRHSESGLASDPLPYLGAPLRYTRPVDHEMRAVQALVTHLENLPVRHGDLVESVAGGAAKRDRGRR